MQVRIKKEQFSDRMVGHTLGSLAVVENKSRDPGEKRDMGQASIAMCSPSQLA